MRCFLFITFFLFLSDVRSQVSVDLESGLATFGYNDVRIPGNEGSLFSLSDDFNNSAKPFFRARLKYSFGKRHSILALYAPLTIKGTGVREEAINFQGTIFNAGTRVNSSWKFNSYRLSYQYNFIMKENFIFALGLTAKIRDAKIRLSNSDQYAEKSNVGVVPLVRFYSDWTFTKRTHLIIDGDALIGKQGRAEDILVALGYELLEPLRVKIGYRLLEGGADNNEVYNFSAVHYGVIALNWTF